MENRVYFINLYDIYGGLLTDKQQAYFEDYYYNNLSLQEICDLYNISRNAVHKQLKEAVNKLEIFEDKLNFFEKSKKIKKVIKELDESIKNKIEELL